MRTKIKYIPPTEPWPDFEDAVDIALDQSALAIKVDYGVTTQTWENQPKFTIKRGKGYRDIYTDNKIYLFVSGGTVGRWVAPVRASVLAFPANYAAKTRPGVIGSSSGGSSGPTAFSKGHWNPGIKARDFPEAIGKKWDVEWPRQLARAIASID